MRYLPFLRCRTPTLAPPTHAHAHTHTHPGTTLFDGGRGAPGGSRAGARQTVSRGGHRSALRAFKLSAVEPTHAHGLPTSLREAIVQLALLLRRRHRLP
eukprot:2393738-Alexandrium_andersonii.AAC.1